MAREENITKAAVLLHLTQPTLSRHLMQLEAELGVQLFRRSRYHIVLTEDGMLLRRRAQELVRLDSPLAGLDSVTPADLEQVPLIISGRERVQQELANWFGDRWERLQIAATFNLILNAANMVRYGVGAALSFNLNFAFDDLRFLPLSPTLNTGTVLVWKKDQVQTPAVEAFHQHIKNVQ